MDGYKWYIRTNEAGIIVHGFSSAFEEPQAGDILIAEDAGRHYNPILTNDRGQFIYRWDNGFLERPKSALEIEWISNLPPDPDIELANAISAATTLEDLKAALLGNGKMASVKGKAK